ncbi:tetratricopeptide repeat protein, partial [Streptomyces coryli]|uniref:tetratricopeptide repeat protein n=1 Tax=Streptomyces coryli TaxID=1128680 RepID=UPI001F0D868C
GYKRQGRGCTAAFALANKAEAQRSLGRWDDAEDTLARAADVVRSPFSAYGSGAGVRSGPKSSRAWRPAVRRTPSSAAPTPPGSWANSAATTGSWSR